MRQVSARAPIVICCYYQSPLKASNFEDLCAALVGTMEKFDTIHKVFLKRSNEGSKAGGKKAKK